MTLFIKWKLMLTTLPFVVAAMVCKYVLDQVVGFTGAVDFGDIGMVLTGGVFLIGFMLAGTMADFKEAEKIPGELACTLETIEETFEQAAVAKPQALDAKVHRKLLTDAVETIRAWLFSERKQDEVYGAIAALTDHARTIERAGAGSYAGRALNEVHNLRKTITRIGVISRTGFLASGYALLETLIAAIVVLLMVAKFKSTLAEYVLVPFVTLIYIYMLRLIRDVDDPFEYSARGPQGAGEVALFPFEEYRERLQKRV